MSQSDGRLISFDVGDDERLIVGTVSREGHRRTIYEGMEPDEYALVPTRELTGDSPDFDVGELRPGDLRVVGNTEFIQNGDDRDVKLSVDGERIVEKGAPGVYGLLWIPLAEL